jgi:tight adherence protein B
MTPRRLLAATLTAATAVAAVAAAAWGASSPQLTPLTSIRFPDRAYVLVMPEKTSLTPGSVQVRENGRLVKDVAVTPARLADQKTFGVILAIDASDSMRGAPIRAAVDAARAFVARKSPTESIGVIVFNDKVTLMLAPTTDAAAITKALESTPRLAVGTRLNDAAAQAIDTLRSAKIKAGSVILLTDGHDIGSTLKRKAVVGKASSAGVRLFTVGLRSPQFSPVPLKTMARATGATYAEAGSSAGLTGIYNNLSEKFGREYLVRYRSDARPDVPIRVAVRVSGVPGTATAQYRTPALPTDLPSPFHRSFIDRFWTSAISAILVALLCGALAWWAVSRIVSRFQNNVRGRIGAFTDESGAVQETQKATYHAPGAQSFQDAVERVLARGAWWERFKEEVEIGRIGMAPTLIVLATVSATVLVMILLGALGSPLLALIALLLPLVVLDHIRRKVREQRDQFAEQLADNLTVMAASLRAGHSFVGALTAVVDEAEEPARTELQRALTAEQLGAPVEDALLEVSRRMDNPDLEQVALVAALHRQTGGNTAQVLDTVVETIRERFALRRLVRTLTAQGRLARWILTGLPVALALIIAVLNPGYLTILFTTTGGQVLLGFGVALLLAGSLMIRRIVDIEL